MFDDPKKHLKQMEDALQEDSEPVRQVSVRNNDRLDVDLDAFSEEVSQPPKEKSNTGLVILALIEAAAIVAVIAYWLAVL